jgi:glycosyltransferase involved in cell wall biosynthesis
MSGAAGSGKVTVLLSTYNGSEFLRQQLDSLYGQTYPDIRILVRDDGSSDSTRAMLEAERARGRLEVLEGHRNLGPARSFFELLKSAVSTDTAYVAFCDQDDVWQPDKIARAVEKLNGVASDRPAMYCARAELVDENLAHLGFTEPPRKIGLGNALVESVAAGCTMVLNRNAARLIGEHLPGNAVIHDWWCYLVVSCFGEVVYDELAVLKYRQHGGNVMGVANEFSRFVKKCRRFFGGGGGRLWMSEQASSLLDIFRDSIPLPNRRVLIDFVAAKESLPRRLRLALSHGIWRQRKSDDLSLRLLIVLNRY